MSDYPGSAVLFRNEDDLISVVRSIRDSTNIPYLTVTIPAVAAYVGYNKQDIPPSIVDTVHELLHEKLLQTNEPPNLGPIVDLLKTALQACGP